MRLATLIPSIPAEFVTCLHNIGIKTDTDLLFSATTFDVYQRLPSTTITLQQLTEYTRTVAQLASAPGKSAVDLLDQENNLRENDPVFSSGVPELDALLGGFGGRRVIEISGDKLSGKTTLILQVVLRHLTAFPNSSVLWVDTTGDFSIERATQLLNSNATEAALTILDRLQVSQATEIEAVHSVLEDLITSFSSGSGPKFRCIVIDTITPLLGPILSAVSSQGHAIMVGLMRQLRAIAQKFSLSVFIINNSTALNSSNPLSNFRSTLRKPALGPSFSFLTDAILWLMADPKNVGGELEDTDTAEYTTLVAEVFKSRTTRSRTWCNFKIQKGLVLSC